MILVIIVASHATASATANSYARAHDDDNPNSDYVAPPSPSMAATDLLPPSNLIHGPYGAYDPLLDVPNTYSLIERMEFNGLVIIQSTSTDLRNMIEVVAASGGIFQDFYPDHAAIFSIMQGPEGISTIESLSMEQSIRWVEPLPTSWRIDPSLLDGQRAFLDIDVHLTRDIGPAELKSMEQSLFQFTYSPGSVIRCEDRLCQARSIDSLVIARLLTDDRVMHISKAASIVSHDADSRSIMGLSPISPAPPLDYDGSGEIVSITDTGIDEDHPSIEDNIRAVYNQFGPDNSASDTNSGHGTHVTGIIVGNASGDDQTLGIAPAAEVNFYQIEYDTSGLLARWGTIYSMFSHSLNNQARTHSNAWGSVNQPGEYTTDSNSADSFIVDQPSYLAVFASGDLGSTQGATTTPPGTAKNVLTVGASTQGSGGEQPPSSPSSNNSGGTLDGRIKPDLVAPGGEICSARAQEATAVPGQSCSDALHGDTTTPLYFSDSGSSMATGTATGAALLVRQHLREDLGISEPDASLVKAILINGASDLGQPDIPNSNEGWGQIDLMRTLSPVSADGTALNTLMDYGHELRPGEAFVQLVDIQQGPLDITLSWTDPEGSVNALDSASRLINDLNLLVTSPSGVQYAGNAFSQGFSIPSTTTDHLNNVERLRLQDAESGTWVVEVRDVAGITQDGYSLVITADAQWVDHADFTVLDDSLRIDDDVIFEGEQLLIQMKWRNQGNILSESYSVEIFDVTEQQSIATNARPRLSPGGTETWAVQHAFQSVGTHLLELRVDVGADVVESNDEAAGSNNNIAQLEIQVSKQGLEIIPLMQDGSLPDSDEIESASSRVLDPTSEVFSAFDFIVKNVGTSDVTISLVATPVKQVADGGALVNPDDEWARIISESGPIELSASGQPNDNITVTLTMIDESADPDAQGTPIFAVPGDFMSRVVVRDIQNPTVVNSRSFEIEVPRVEGLQILASGLDDFSSRPGNFASFDMAVLNTGNGDTVYEAQCTSASGWSTRVDSILSDTVLLPELARLEYITIPISVLVPPASLGLPPSGHLEIVTCTISSPDGGGPSETIQASLVVEESRDFTTKLTDGDGNELPPIAASDDRPVLNMVRENSTLEIYNRGNIDMQMSVTIRLSDSTWGLEATLNPESPSPVAISVFDGGASIEVSVEAGSMASILATSIAPPTASMGDRALLTFRTTEGQQVTVIDSSRFILQPRLEISMQAPGTLEILAGDLAEFPLSISNTGNVRLDLSWAFTGTAEGWSIGLQSISPSFIEPNQDLTLLMGVGVPSGWPVDQTGEVVSIIVEGSNELLEDQIELQSADIQVSVRETCGFSLEASEYPSVEAGDYAIFSATVVNVGNIPSAFSMDVTQESDVFSELSASGQLSEMAPGESRTLDFNLGVDKEATPGIENFLVTFYPVGQSCEETNLALTGPQSVTVYVLPATGSGIGNSLPPYVMPLVFILLVFAATVGIISLRRTSPESENPGEDLIPEGSALMQGEASTRRMNALSTDAADQTLSTIVKRDDMEAAIRDSMPKLDLPPLPGKKTPPVPPSGLPEGWSMDQWREYGSEWLKENQG